MKKNILISAAVLFVAWAGFPSCNPMTKAPEASAQSGVESGNGIYYWKTRFELNDFERDFLKTYSVRRLYVRMFDVDYDSSPLAGSEKVIPVATTSFISPRPEDIEIVPTVFVSARALVMAVREMGSLDSLAHAILSRVFRMMEYNDLGAFREIQLDCDWVASSKDDFYRFCKVLGKRLHAERKQLSVTIRLHQLKMEAPAADRGVLMLYNTGALRAEGKQNSILSEKDVKNYLSGAGHSFGIPLDFAFPTFGWGVWFRGHMYMGLLHETEYSDDAYYKKDKDGGIRVVKKHVLENHELHEGDRIRLESSSPETILKVKSMVRRAFGDVLHNNILYHLDANNLKKYTPDEIQAFYSD